MLAFVHPDDQSTASSIRSFRLIRRWKPVTPSGSSGIGKRVNYGYLPAEVILYRCVAGTAGRRYVEDTIPKLMEVSENAQQREAMKVTRITVENAAALVARNWGRSGRRLILIAPGKIVTA